MEASFTNPCTGETIVLTGTVLFVLSQFTAPTGGNHLAVTQAWQDVTGVSESGTMYRFTNSSMGNQQNPLPGGGPVTSTQEFRAISQTSLDNFVIQSTFHVTVANGEIVVVDENFTTECRG